MEGKVTLSQKEQKRLMVLNQVEKGEIRGREAAEVLGISLRHTRRLLAAYRKKGASALAHGNRERKPYNTLDATVVIRVIGLARTKYAGFNTRHLTEMLGENEGIALSRSTVRRKLIEGNVSRPRKRRPPRHRSRRERYSKEGMLLQIDASPHDWLQGRGPKMNLVGAIDDATGKVPYALFREQEDSLGYFLLLRQIVSRYGIPLALYHDRHSIFEASPEELERQTIPGQLSGKPMLTQFGRLMGVLGITSISALSPQAKGRIERLWETFQDRLVSELRLAGVSTMEEANRFLESFLERYNARFAVPPEQPGLAYHSAQGLEMETIFCFKYQRVASADNVVRFNGQRLQILPSLDRLSYARCPVEVHQQFDGSLKVYYRGRYLDTRPAPVEATRARELSPVALSPPQPRPHSMPPPDHPWRRWVYRANRE